MALNQSNIIKRSSNLFFGWGGVGGWGGYIRYILSPKQESTSTDDSTDDSNSSTLLPIFHVNAVLSSAFKYSIISSYYPSLNNGE